MERINRKNVFGNGENEENLGVVAGCSSFSGFAAVGTNTYYTHEAKGGEKHE